MESVAPEPLSIVGVVADQVGTPRNDGTPGSALYAVPIRLNREPDEFERRFLIETWDRPPSWSTMHRPGIMKVRGDGTLILDGTKIDEVRDVHAKTLRLVVDRVNQLAQEERRRGAAELARRESDRQAHEEHVAEVTKEIEF